MLPFKCTDSTKADKICQTICRAENYRNKIEKSNGLDQVTEIFLLKAWKRDSIKFELHALPHVWTLVSAENMDDLPEFWYSNLWTYIQNVCRTSSVSFESQWRSFQQKREASKDRVQHLYMLLVLQIILIDLHVVKGHHIVFQEQITCLQVSLVVPGRTRQSFQSENHIREK